MTKKLFVFLVSLIFILTTGLSAFAVDIKGIVIDSRTDEQLSGVNIYIEETMKGDMADSSGYFEIDNIDAGNYNLIVRLIGYKEKAVNIDNVIAKKQ